MHITTVQVTSGETDSLFPSWSPDGEYVIFTSNRSAERAGKTGEEPDIDSMQGPFNLYVISPRGTGLIQLTDGEGLNLHPEWGEDGWIYFSSDQAGNFDIWRLRPGVL